MSHRVGQVATIKTRFDTEVDGKQGLVQAVFNNGMFPVYRVVMIETQRVVYVVTAELSFKDRL